MSVLEGKADLRLLGWTSQFDPNRKSATSKDIWLDRLLRLPGVQFRQLHCPYSGASAVQVRTGDQPQDCQNARPHHTAYRPRASRRGDRMKIPFAAMHESVV